MSAIPILVIAVVQGWALYGLHYAIDNKIWPATDLPWLLALYAGALLVPTALQIVAARLREPLTWLMGGVLAVVVGALGAYTGWMLESLTDRLFNFGSLFALYGALFTAWFIALPFAQARLRRGAWRASYLDLFEFSWQNTLVLAEATVFTGVFWLLLMLWQALFKVINISFFAELFAKRAFIYPVTAIAFGYAIYLIESNEKIVVTVRRHLLGVFSWFLPLVALIALLFLVALPVTGLQPLWKTGYASTLMLWLQIAFIHFLNSAYQDGQAEPRYPQWLKLVIRAAVFALPIYAVLCAYSVGLRVGQHGWTMVRVWGAIATFLVGAYGVAYAVAALRRSPWMGRMAPINVAMAVMVAAVLLLAVSPVLDPRRLSTDSQLARLRSGSVSAAKFDYDYLRFQLGRYGRDAVAELAKSSDAEVARLAAASLAKTSRYATRERRAPESVATQIDLLPPGTLLEPEFVAYLEQAVKQAAAEHPSCLRVAGARPCLLYAIDLNGDGIAELVTFSGYPMPVYGKVGGRWTKVGNLSTRLPRHGGRSNEQLLREGSIKAEPHQWSDVLIGDTRYVMQPVP